MKDDLTMRPGGSRRTSPGCRSCCERSENRFIVTSIREKLQNRADRGRKAYKGAFGCRDISSQYADRVGLSMTLMVQTCLMLQRHFLMLSAKSWSCEKRARTTIRLW